MASTPPLLLKPYTIQAERVGADLGVAIAISSHLPVKRLAAAVDLEEQQTSRSLLWSLTSALIAEMSNSALLYAEQ